MSRSDSAAEHGRSGRSGARTALKVVLAVLVVLLLLGAAAPTLLSSGPGRNFVIGRVNVDIPGTLEVENLRLRWLSGQSASGVRLRDPDGAEVLKLETFSTDLSLVGALRGQLILGDTLMRGLRVVLVVDDTGRENLSAALGLEPAVEDAPAEQLMIPVTGTMLLEDAYLSWVAPGIEPVVLDDLNARLEIDLATRELAIDASGRSRQGDLGGDLTATGTLRNWLDSRDRLTPATAEMDLDARLDQFPVQLVDGLAGLHGLLVAALGEQISVELQGAGRRLELRADAPNLAVDLAADTAQQRFVLTRPTSVRWTLTPALMAMLPAEGDGDDPLVLREAVDLRLALERLDMSLADFDLSAVALHARFDSSAPLRLSGGGMGDVSLRDLAAEISSDRLADAVTLAAGLAIHSDGRVGQLRVDGALSDLFDSVGRLQIERMQVEATAALSDLPTLLLDRVTGSDGLLLAALGPRIDLAARASTDGDGTDPDDGIDIRLDLRSELLRAEGVQLRLGDALTLVEPARMRYRLTPALVARLAVDAPNQLASPADLELMLNALAIPLATNNGAMLQPEQSRAQATFTAPALELLDPEGVRTRVHDLRLELGGDSLAAITVTGSGQVTQTAPGILAQLEASPLALLLDARTRLDAHAAPGVTAGTFELSGGGLSATVPFSISAGMEQFTLTAPAEFAVTLTPALLAEFMATEAGPSDIRLARSADLRMTLQRLDVALAEPSLAGMRAEGSAALGALQFLTGDAPLAALDGLDAVLELNGAEGRGRITLDGRVSAAGAEPGTLEGNITLADLKPDGTGNMALDVNLTRLPAALAGILTNQPAMPEMLGSAVDLQLGAQLALGDAPTGTGSLRVTSQHLSAQAAARLGDTLSLERPAEFRLNLTPAAWAALQPPTEAGEGQLLLVTDAVVEAVISRLTLPLGEMANGRLPDLVARLNVPMAELRQSRSGERFDFQALVVNLGTEDTGKRLHAQLNGRVAKPGEQTGEVQVDFRAAELFNGAGELDLEGMSVDVDGRLIQMPVGVVDSYLDMGGLMVATLGRTVEGRLDGALREGEGPLNLQMRGDNASADFKGQWTRGTLTLRDTFTAEVNPSEDFGRLVLSQLHPVFETMRGGEQPIRFAMPAAGVEIPVAEWALAGLKIPEMSLALGSVELESGWLLEGLVTLGQRFGTLRSMGDRWSAEFTPAVMSVVDGKLAYKRRIDLLVGDQMHFATWGEMNLLEERADLVFAIMPLTLRSVFSIAAAENDALRVPLRGDATAANVDFTRIGVELARMQATRRLGQANPLLGALFGSGGGNSNAMRGAPQPSISPLPWSERLERQAAEAERRARERREAEQQQQQ